ncbi:MAG: hypothetical protein AB1454_03590 [Candidatus Auribacterota bacterium]
MPDTSTNITARSAQSEEQIVQKIVELLNERGYEYERDIRPIICWKYNVSSSRELSYDQKIAVKSALENGSFEQWGKEYRQAVLNQEVDILQQIDQLKDTPSPIKLDNKEHAPKAKTAKKETGEAAPKTDDAPAKISVKLKSKAKTEIPADEPSSTVNASNTDESVGASKIQLPSSAPILTKTEDVAESAPSKKLIDGGSIKLNALNKSDADKKTAKSIQKKDNEALDTQPDAKVTETAQPLSETITSDADATAAKKTLKAVVKDAPVTSLRKKDQIFENKDNDDKKTMDIEEAKSIVKNKYQSELHESKSVFAAILLFVAIALFGASLYINIVLITQPDLPEWLKFICNFLK